MRAIIEVEPTDRNGRCFLTWAPVRATLRLEEADRTVAGHDITLRNAGPVGGGRVVFATRFTQSDAAVLTLPDVASDGTPRTFWVAGEFQSGSSAYGDMVIEAVDSTNATIGQRDGMVRVRKNALVLTAAERDLFLDALGQLNDAGEGPFRAFRDMHVAASAPEAHGAAGFLPWHRAYLLDLERCLQEVEPAVALPYWRFDQAAAALFDPAFLGSPSNNPGASDLVIFPPGHALEFWTTDGAVGIARRPRWNITLAPPRILDETATFELGGATARYAGFRGMEVNPHGFAHTSFSGPVNSVPTAARDPLFFLLHTNVDRLWARWQWLNRRSNADDQLAYSVFGSSRPDGGGTVGHRLDDTMWPWNQDRMMPRPNFVPPRAGLPPSPYATAPGTGSPRVRDMIDFHGLYGRGSLGFSYDDVPFEIEA